RWTSSDDPGVRCRLSDPRYCTHCHGTYRQGDTDPDEPALHSGPLILPTTRSGSERTPDHRVRSLSTETKDSAISLRSNQGVSASRETRRPSEPTDSAACGQPAPTRRYQPAPARPPPPSPGPTP